MTRWHSLLALPTLVMALGLGHVDPVEGSPAAARIRIHASPSEVLASSRHGGTLALDEGGLWIVERSAGVLVRTDLEGRVVASASFGPGMGELVLDPAARRLFVADRRGDRLVRIDTRSGAEVVVDREIVVREPHGLSLSPDGATLLVTSVAQHELVAIDADSLTEGWRVELMAEPRGVAIAPDGRRAVVSFVTSGAVAEVDLETRAVRWHALDPRDPVEVELVDDGWGEEFQVLTIAEAPSRFEVPNDIGRRHARNAFAVAFVGDIALVPHQVATPQIERRPDPGRRDSYGGGGASIPPIAYRLAAISASAQPRFEDIPVAQPRSLVHDGGRGVLYVGGYGDDEIVALSSSGASVRWSAFMKSGCGVDGLAPTPDGKGLWVHCELTRSLTRIALDEDGRPLRAKHWLKGDELVASAHSPEVDRGAELFRRNGDARISGSGVLACANCHPEGRNDGLSWRLGPSILQTPMLAGRVDGTAPYKWDGQDPNLRASIHHTIARLGGEPSEMRRSEIAAIEAYLLALEDPRPPNIDDQEALRRGRAVFDRECSGCHDGPATTDHSQHALTTSLPLVDTPSLRGLAHTAPYYHDGSALDLAALIDDRGNVHDMVDTSGLRVDERNDLATYLESL